VTERWQDIVGPLRPPQYDEFLRTARTPDIQAAGLHFPWFAHPGQTEPPGDWTAWVLMAGRGFGKTRAGAEWLAGLVREAGGRSPIGEPFRIALVAATLDEARRIMVEGASGLLAVAPDLVEEWAPHRRLLRLAGAELTLFSGASPEALRGPEHHLAWCDELAKWKAPGDSWDMLRLGLRLGDRPRVLVTTTPRPGPALRRILAEPGTVLTNGPTDANPHLPPAFKDGVRALYAGTRLGRQELEGELLTDNPGALWTVELLERCRAYPPRDGEGDRPPKADGGGGAAPGAEPPPFRPAFVQTVIGVDPPAADGTCGIIACARDETGHAHVLADHSVSARSPEAWARAVANAARLHGTPHDPALVVAEANQGGRMVEAVLRTADPDLRLRLVHATAGKAQRAEPVAHLFEAGRVTMHARFPELEAQLCGLIGGGGYEGPGASPDRADAMVWALTELMLRKRSEPRITRL